MQFSLKDKNLLYEYPMLGSQVLSLNTQLRSFCLTGNSWTLEEDDGGFPCISKVEFGTEDVASIRKIIGNTRIGQKPKSPIFIDILLEIDYGNGYLENLKFTMFKDDPLPLFQAIHEKSVYLFRSLYGFRKERKD